QLVGQVLQRIGGLPLRLGPLLGRGRLLRLLQRFVSPLLLSLGFLTAAHLASLLGNLLLALLRLGRGLLPWLLACLTCGLSGRLRLLFRETFRFRRVILLAAHLAGQLF